LKPTKLDEMRKTEKLAPKFKQGKENRRQGETKKGYDARPDSRLQERERTSMQMVFLSDPGNNAPNAKWANPRRIRRTFDIDRVTSWPTLILRNGVLLSKLAGIDRERGWARKANATVDQRKRAAGSHPALPPLHGIQHQIPRGLVQRTSEMLK
jgi:hypothetical protein